MSQCDSPPYYPSPEYITSYHLAKSSAEVERLTQNLDILSRRIKEMKDCQKQVLDSLKEFLGVLETDYEQIKRIHNDNPEMLDTRDVKFLADLVAEFFHLCVKIMKQGAFERVLQRTRKEASIMKLQSKRVDLQVERFKENRPVYRFEAAKRSSSRAPNPFPISRAPGPPPHHTPAQAQQSFSYNDYPHHQHLHHPGLVILPGRSGSRVSVVTIANCGNDYSENVYY